MQELNEAQEEQTVVLYDYLYRDASRIASYYAQLFNGRLTGLEDTDSTTETEENTGKLNIQVAAGEMKATKAFNRMAKRLIDPHDVVTSDVLSYLSEKYIQHDVDIEDASNGAVVLLEGGLTVIDRSVIELVQAGSELITAAEMAKPEEERNQQSILGLTMLQHLGGKFNLPSTFILHLGEGKIAGGIIKESGMEDAVSTYNYRFGSGVIPNIYVIGIKEEPQGFQFLDTDGIFSAAQHISQGLSDLLFPADAVRITPLAIFRKL